MKDTKWLIDSLFAHRGLHNEVYPENTLGAFKHAVSKNYDLECDIQLTKDEKIVVFHDKNLKRLCNVDRVLEECTYLELQEFNIKGTEEKIPLLDEFLRVLPETTKLLIEFKPTSRHKRIVELFLKRMEHVPNMYAIHSFDPRILVDFRKLAPEVIRGFISENFSIKEYGLTGKMCGKLLFNKSTQPDFINYGLKDLPSKLLDKQKRKGRLVLSYTARTQKELDFVRDRYDNAVFENFEAKQK